MAIKITVKAPEYKYFYSFITQNLNLVSAEHLCAPGIKFEDKDSYLVSPILLDCLQRTVNYIYMTQRIEGKFKIWVNSLYRKPFTRLWTGKIDYLDLTTPFSHWLGLSVDIDFITFEEKTGLKASVLAKALKNSGLFCPWPASEPWHYSVAIDEMDRRF